ncbi:MAG: DMT family transporter [Lachnospiraceae bacterium]|nr:DMT family transporter [Lachnospiraceae bacterium]
MIGFFIALISGALMSIQGVFNTEVTKNSSIWVANVFVQLTAFLVCAAAWIVSDRTSFQTLAKIEPKYMLLGGAIGAFITYTVIKSMDMLGPAKAVMVIVVAQLLVAYVIELFGMFGVEKVGFDWKKAVGMAIAIAGIILFKWES